MPDTAETSGLLKQGIAAAKAGRKEEARHLLMRVVDEDERNEQAWLWLSGVVDSAEDRQICLENVLAINPDNAHAQAGLKWLQKHAPPPPPAPAETREPPAAAPREEPEPPAAPTATQPEPPPAPLIVAPEPPAAPAEIAEPPADDPAALMEAARRHAEAGEPRRAVDLLTRVVELQPMHAEAYVRLGDAYRLAGRQAEARQAYATARQLTSETSGLGQEARHKLARMEQVPPAEQQRARASAARSNRPGCVTVYAVLLALGGILGILGACGLMALAGTSLAELEQTLALQDAALPVSAGQLSTLVLIAGGVALVLNGANVGIAVGLWQMKNWARIAVIALLGLGLVLGVAQAAASLLSFRETLAAFGMQSVSTFFIVGSLVSFVVQAYIIFWFVANRELFV